MIDLITYRKMDISQSEKQVIAKYLTKVEASEDDLVQEIIDNQSALYRSYKKLLSKILYGKYKLNKEEKAQITNAISKLQHNLETMEYLNTSEEELENLKVIAENFGKKTQSAVSKS